ncbi:hypothetical protein HYW41_01725 [Candidatus Daviesbacteria bacterium]|nr:hypothetical protein [Candidatus Daviesbacteria bacterium]
MIFFRISSSVTSLLRALRQILLSSKLRLLILIIGLNQIFIAFIVKELYPIHLPLQKLFFFDLIELNVYIPEIGIYLVNIFNLILIWLISKQLFSSNKSLIPVALFAFSPWSSYLIVTQSMNIYLLCLILMSALGFLLIKSRKRLLGVILFALGVILSFYSSFLSFVFLPIILGLILFKFNYIKEIKTSFILILIFCMPLIFYFFRNLIGVKNIYERQITFFSDSSLIAVVNNFQGNTKKAGFGLLSKAIENKYLYISEYSLLKILKNLTPTTYFTSQEKLVGFSFSPPILLGFLIPFLYGITIIIFSPTLRKYLSLSAVLIIPSFLSKSLVDMENLIFLEPIIILIISFGLINLKSNKRYKGFLYLTFVLILIQLIVIIFDINQREYLRFVRFYGANLVIGRP